MKPSRIETLPAITIVIAKAHGWSWTSDGHYAAYLFTEDGEQVTALYSPQDLDNVDNRFRPVLDELLVNTHRAHSYLRRTLELWNNPMPVLSTPGLSNIYIERIVAVSGHHNSNDKGKISCICDLYLASTTEEGIPYCSNPDTKDVVVPLTWLEQHFPGSVERLRIGQSLELSSTDLADFMVTPTPEGKPLPLLPGDLTDSGLPLDNPEA